MRTVLVAHSQQAPAAAHTGFCQGPICPAPGQALCRLCSGCISNQSRGHRVQIKAHTVGWAAQWPHPTTRMTKCPAGLSTAAETLSSTMTKSFPLNNPKFANTFFCLFTPNLFPIMKTYRDRCQAGDHELTLEEVTCVLIECILFSMVTVMSRINAKPQVGSKVFLG